MRRVLPWLLASLAGAGVAVLGALASHWWRSDDLPAGSPRRYVDYLPVETDWAGLLIPAALTGAVLGPVVLAIAQLVGPPRSRTPTIVAALLAPVAVALLGVLASYLWLRRDDAESSGYYAYSPLPNATNTQVTYASDLDITVDTDWAALLAPAAVAGALLGLAVVVVVRARLRRSPGQVDGA